MKNILITGNTGFLGGHLVKKISYHNLYFYNSKIANLGDEKNLYIYNAIKFDYIFHLAVVTKAGAYCMKFKGDQWLYNQKLNTNILSYWKNYQ